MGCYRPPPPFFLFKKKEERGREATPPFSTLELILGRKDGCFPLHVSHYLPLGLTTTWSPLVDRSCTPVLGTWRGVPLNWIPPLCRS